MHVLLEASGSLREQLWRKAGAGLGLAASKDVGFTSEKEEGPRSKGEFVFVMGVAPHQVSASHSYDEGGHRPNAQDASHNHQRTSGHQDGWKERSDAA